MIINILAGGPTDLLPDLRNYNEEDSIWVGVDHGVSVLLSRGIQPAIGFGDFDSVTEEEFQGIQTSVPELKTFNPEKDETDMELALNWAFKQIPKKIRIFGGTGGRLDHFFANVQLIIKPVLMNSPCQIEIIDTKNLIYVKGPGSYQLKKLPDRKYVSFVPISLEVDQLSLAGFKYPLTQAHLPLGSTLCISNELIHDYGTFSFAKGILMVIRSCD